MTPNNASLNAFIALMRKGGDASRMRVAFEVLIKKSAPHLYLDRLQEEGLLTTVPSTQSPGGGTALHDWPSAKYLSAVTTFARTAEDVDLCRKVLAVVRAVTAEATNEAVANNYQIWVACAEIVGQLPVELIGAADVSSMQTWLMSRYDSSLVALELTKGLIPALLSSEQPEAKARLVELLELLTHFELVESAGDTDDRVRSRVDPYWLRKILSNFAEAMGASCGLSVVNVLHRKLVELLKHYRQLPSWMYRPAIEENNQNIPRYDVKEAFIVASRDVAEGFLRVAKGSGGAFVADLLQSQVPMLFRIGVHIARLNFDVCQDALRATINPSWFISEARHELYLLLKERFGSFDEDLRIKVIQVLGLLHRPEHDVDDPSFRERYWLTVVRQWQEPRVMSRLEALREQYGPEELDKHDGLIAYYESRSGDPPSPFPPSALQSLAQQGNLVEVLNAFEPSDQWDGPSVRSVVHALEKAVLSAPNLFLLHARDLLAAKPAYQYALLSGFAQLWEQGRNESELRISAGSWESLLALTSEILAANDISTSDESLPPLTPQASWLPGMVAAWIQSAVKDDGYALDAALLPKALDIVYTLLERLPAEQENAEIDDAVQHAINSPRGKVVEALLACCLRARRTGVDSDAVAGVLARLEKGLADAKDLEVSTLLTGALPQLEYLQKGWVEAHVSQLFPILDATRLRWALQGLAHSPASRWLHVLLQKTGVYPAALAIRTNLGEAWESLVDRFLVAYVHGDEVLDSLFWLGLIEERDYGSLQHAAWFLWTQRREPLTDAQRKSIVEWWLYIDQRVDMAEATASNLKGALVRLLWALPVDDARAPRLLLDAAHYARPMHHEYEFVEELTRFVTLQTDASVAALNEMLSQGIPVIDYQDTYYNILISLHDAGAIEAAVSAANVMRHIPKIWQLFQRFQGRESVEPL